MMNNNYFNRHRRNQRQESSEEQRTGQRNEEEERNAVRQYARRMYPEERVTEMKALEVPARAEKRRGSTQDNPPSAGCSREPKRPRDDSEVEEKVFGPGTVKLTRNQRANPLTIVLTSPSYPETLLNAQQFAVFRQAVRREVDRTPTEHWPKFEVSFCRGGVFVVIASDAKSKDWLGERLPRLELWDGAAALIMGGAELVQRMVKATAWLPGDPLDPSEALRRLEAYNPELRTSSWKLCGRAEIGGEPRTSNGTTQLHVQMPESQAAALRAMECRPYYDLGRVCFSLSAEAEGNNAASKEAQEDS